MPSRILIGLLVAGSLILLWPALLPTIRAQNASQPLPGGDPIRGARIALSCSRCHGEGGITTDAWVPRLAGLSQRAIYKQLDDYRFGRRRPEWYMASIARALSLQDSADVSAYYEGKGRGFAKPAQSRKSPHRLASCAKCHDARGGDAPPILGQQPQYLEVQWSLFAQGIRTNDQGGVHQKIAHELTLQEIHRISEELGQPSH